MKQADKTDSKRKINELKSHENIEGSEKYVIMITMINTVIQENLNLILVFAEGGLSFFSPCVLPLIPLYMSALSSGARKVDENGKEIYKQSSVFFYTLCFILGICSVYILMAASASKIASWISRFGSEFSIIGGIVIILFGLYQLGIIKSNWLSRQFKLNLKHNQMSPLTAFLLGFCFSFAWTPCVGPTLTSVLILASSSSIGYLYILLYALGFVVPFLLLGLFTAEILNFLRSKRNIVQITSKVMAVLLMVMGAYMLQDGIKAWQAKGAQNIPVSNPDGDEEEYIATIEDYDFTLKDQDGNEITLSDYKGKVIFLNFFGTWCGPCQSEMPAIQRMYEKYGYNEGDLIILSIAHPNDGQEVSESEIAERMKNWGYSYPVLFDSEDTVFYRYYVSAFPTSFVIDKEGKFLGYIQGAISEEYLEEIFLTEVGY